MSGIETIIGTIISVAGAVGSGVSAAQKPGIPKLPPPKEDAAAKRVGLERQRLRNISGFRQSILGSAYAAKTKLGQ